LRPPSAGRLFAEPLSGRPPGRRRGAWGYGGTAVRNLALRHARARIRPSTAYRSR
jgi:hypothetical protein